MSNPAATLDGDAAGAERARLSVLAAITPAALVLGLWLAFHPYGGIVHDSRLYVAQALNAIHPEIFGHDLFFLYGSQDDYSLFSHLFAPLVAWLGPSTATVVIVVVGQALWLSGAAALVLRVAPERAMAIAALAALVALPGTYGGWRTFFFAEGFATPRLIAEALTLWALWAIMGHRRHGLALAALLLALAGMLHPLMAAAGAAVAALYLMIADRRFALAALAGAAVLAGAALADIPPFDRLGATMDPEWYDVVAARNIYLFPALWTAADWSRIAVSAGACLAAAAIVTGGARRLFLAAMGAGALGLLAMHIGADLLRDVFIIQVQPNRTLWLMQMAAGLGLGLLMLRLWREKDDGVALAAAMVFGWLVQLALHPPTGAVLCLFALALAVLRVTGRMGPLPPVARHGMIGFAAATLLFLVIYRVSTLLQWWGALPDLRAFREIAAAPNAIETTTAAAIAALLWRYRPAGARRIAPAAALCFALLAAATWDRRDGWTVTVAEAHPVAEFEAHLAPGAQVFWERDARGAWLLLRRASYVSALQGAGIAFDRRTALAFRDRARVVEPLIGDDMIDVFRSGKAGPIPLPTLDRDKLRAACGRDASLDALVLSRAVPGAFVTSWAPPRPVLNLHAIRLGIPQPPIDRFYLYLCRNLR